MYVTQIFTNALFYAITFHDMIKSFTTSRFNWVNNLILHRIDLFCRIKFILVQYWRKKGVQTTREIPLVNRHVHIHVNWTVTRISCNTMHDWARLWFVKRVPSALSSSSIHSLMLTLHSFLDAESIQQLTVKLLSAKTSAVDNIFIVVNVLWRWITNLKQVNPSISLLNQLLNQSTNQSIER